ncbi:MAG: hypothetical protein CMC79_03865 [Flavobacteriaceae bacterium]|nr:hypothetical protein [Flavobacteriaceae bacterium]|tara:strand:+ start:9007 stop:9192 length:186 start_codon:yes stop_codon:yes gene_type:complete
MKKNKYLIILLPLGLFVYFLDNQLASGFLSKTENNFIFIFLLLIVLIGLVYFIIKIDNNSK